jgi:hypothetical protein
MEEVARFRLEKLADFKHITLDFVQLQIDYAKKVRGWNLLSPPRQPLRLSIISRSPSVTFTTALAFLAVWPACPSASPHQMEQAWSALIPELEGIQADESAGGLTSDAAGAAAGASE